MSRRTPRKRVYDIVFAGEGSIPRKLNARDRDALTRILGKPPSPEFLEHYSSMLGQYASGQAVVKQSTASAMQKRFAALAAAATTLHARVSKLSTTDIIFFNNGVRKRTPRHERHALPELTEKLTGCIAMFRKAEALLNAEPQGGRMPAYAEIFLAKGLCQILFEELGKKPTTSKRGRFDMLLRHALSHGKAGKARADVKDLLRFGLEDLPDKIHFPLLKGRAEFRGE